MRILISRLSALGDVVCSLPAAVALKSTFPDSRITWVVDPRFAGIVECCSAVDEIVPYKPTRSWSTVPTYTEKFDVALDLQGLLKSALGIARAKADRKLGYHWQREGARFFSQAVLPDPTSFHIVDQYVDVAREAGAEASRAQFWLAPKNEDLESLKSKIPNSKFVVINPGAGWASKRWPAESFAELTRFLAGRGIASVLIGGRADADKEVGNQVKKAAGTFVNLIGQTSVRELVALISQAGAHVGGDTGSTHIAAALNIPAIGLYSITKPKRSCPYGQIERCLYNEESLAKIDVDDVFRMVLGAMA